jgi:hypothetical protein
MTGNGKKALAASISRFKANLRETDDPRLAFSEAATEIAHALKIKSEAAAMTLYGLCATGNIRWVDIQGAIVDEDDCTIADFGAKPALVVAADVRSWLTGWSPDPQPSKRVEVINAMLAEGLVPPRKINWKSFCKRVRDACNGWIGDKAALGFSDKQIQRLVKELRAK